MYKVGDIVEILDSLPGKEEYPGQLAELVYIDIMPYGIPYLFECIDSAPYSNRYAKTVKDTWNVDPKYQGNFLWLREDGIKRAQKKETVTEAMIASIDKLIQIYSR